MNRQIFSEKFVSFQQTFEKRLEKAEKSCGIAFERLKRHSSYGNVKLKNQTHFLRAVACARVEKGEGTSVTIYDIAREAGVSASSVSRVINNKPGVSRANRDKINALLEKYHFVSNETARGLVTVAANW